MPDPISAGIAAVGSIGSSVVGASAAGKAGRAQVRAAEAGAAEQRAAREETRRLLEPYVAAGTPALRAQMEILGLATPTTDWEGYARSNPELMQAYNAQQAALSFGGFPGVGMIPGAPKQDLAEFAQDWYSKKGGDISRFTTTAEQAQARAIAQQEQSPIFQALARQGEEAMLQNASATGGLRGGNLQGALAQFRPALLNQFLEQQYQRLGGMTTLGQQSATGVGSAGMQAAGAISELLGQGGAAKAGAKLGAAQSWANVLNMPAQFAGFAYGAGKPGLGGIFN